MTSGCSAERKLSTPGPLGSLTVGAETLIDIGSTDSGRLGVVHDLGCFEDSLHPILRQNGLPEGCIVDTAQRITRLLWAWLLDQRELSTSDTQKQPIDSEKQQSTPTSGS